MGGGYSGSGCSTGALMVAGVPGIIRRHTRYAAGCRNPMMVKIVPYDRASTIRPVKFMNKTPPSPPPSETIPAADPTQLTGYRSFTRVMTLVFQIMWQKVMAQIRASAAAEEWTNEIAML